jgi:Putative Zn-dependent protease
MRPVRPFRVAAAALLLVACATNPVSKKPELVLMSEKQELALGQRAAAEIARQMPLMPADDPLVKYVDKVGQRLAAVSDRPELFYRFHVVDLPTINAFALPGGYIYIYRGLLVHMNSEAELAAVLGHEIGHVTARHAVQRYTQVQGYRLGMAVASIFLPIPQPVGQLSDLLALAVIQGYGRKDELQADELAIRYLARAGYDPHAAIRILQTLKRMEDIRIKEDKATTGKAPPIYHGAFASHPETKKRIEEAVRKAAGEQSVLGYVGHRAMLAALEGYPYGDSADQGAVIGRRFIHPKLGIRFAFPRGWAIKNTPQALRARRRREKAFFVLKLRELSKHTSGRKILRSLFPGRRLRSFRTWSQGGFAMASAEINASFKAVGQARALAAVAMDGPRAWILVSYCRRVDFARYLPDFTSILSSFRRYDRLRDGGIPRISLYTWKPGDSWRHLAAASRHILGPFTATRLAALNGMDVNASPKPGTIVKIVKNR